MATTIPPTTASGAEGRAEPAPEDILEEVERVLASPDFRGSQRRRALLQFLVDETLAGRGDRLKGASVAVAVFGRGTDFDSQSDPVVRLEARRLRRDLDGYYVAAGGRDPVRITIPTGSYRPRFEAVVDAPPAPGPTPAPGPAAASPRRRLWLRAGVPAVVAAVALLGGAAWSWRHFGPPSAGADDGPAVIVVPFDALGTSADDHDLASGISYELVSDLMRFPHFRVYSSPTETQAAQDPDPKALGRDLGVAYVVKGALRSDGDAVRVAAQVYDADTGRVIWSDTYDRSLTPGDLLEVQGELASSIATALGEPYGKVNADVTQRLAAGTLPTMPSYTCVLRAYQYRRGFDEKLYQPVLGCLQAAVVRDPGFAPGWAMLGWLQLDAARFGYVPPDQKSAQLDRAIASASRAVDLDRTDPLGLQALSAALYYAGRYQESMAVQRGALALNPDDPDTLAQLGWRLAARGDFEEGIPYIQRAIARSANPPGWYFHLLAVHDYLMGDYQAMLDTAERSAVDGSDISWSFIAIAQGALGHTGEARAALDRWRSRDPDAYADPAAAYRLHGGNPDIIDALMNGLRKAGWTGPQQSAAP